MLSSHVKRSSLLWLDNKSRLSKTILKGEKVWYSIGVYTKNKTSYTQLDIRNFSSRVRSLVKYFSTFEEKFVSPRSNVLSSISAILEKMKKLFTSLKGTCNCMLWTAILISKLPNLGPANRLNASAGGSHWTKGFLPSFSALFKEIREKNIQQLLNHVIYCERNQLKPKGNRMEDN